MLKKFIKIAIAQISIDPGQIVDNKEVLEI